MVVGDEENWGKEGDGVAFYVHVKFGIAGLA